MNTAGTGTARRSKVTAYPHFIYGDNDPESVHFRWLQSNCTYLDAAFDSRRKLLPCSAVSINVSSVRNRLYRAATPRWVSRLHVSPQLSDQPQLHPSTFEAHLHSLYLHSSAAAFASVIQEEYLCTGIPVLQLYSSGIPAAAL